MGVAALLESIPYVVWHRIDVTEEGPVRFEMELLDRLEIHNYVGTLHAGALYTLAETVAGVAADSVAQGLGAFILLREANIKYTRRAEGNVRGIAEVDETAAGAASNTFKEASRADLPIDVAIQDGDGLTVFEGTFIYAIRPRKS